MTWMGRSACASGGRPTWSTETERSVTRYWRTSGSAGTRNSFGMQWLQGSNRSAVLSSYLFSAHRQQYLSLVTGEAMLPEEDSLPGAERASAGADRQVEIRLRQDAADVRRHIVGTFRVVGEHRVAVRHQPGHECFQILANGRVCVLAQHQRRAGVADEHV